MGQRRKNGKKCAEGAKSEGGKDKMRGLAKRTAQFPPKPERRAFGALRPLLPKAGGPKGGTRRADADKHKKTNTTASGG